MTFMNRYWVLHVHFAYLSIKMRAKQLLQQYIEFHQVLVNVCNNKNAMLVLQNATPQFYCIIIHNMILEMQR